MTTDIPPHPAAAYWPPARLRVITPRLELRLPTDAELVDLVDVALAGVHDPQEMPFAHPWTDEPPELVARGLLQWHWSNRASWQPERWNMLFEVFVNGVIVGAQDMAGRHFRVQREISSGSWLSRAWQGRGLGTEMRDAMLHLAFDGLQAQYANPFCVLVQPRVDPGQHQARLRPRRP